MQTRSKSATHVTKSIHSATPPHGKTTRAQSAPALIRKECSSLHKELETLQTAYNALKEEKRRLAEENILLTETLRVYYRNVLYMAIRKLYSRAQADQAGCPLVADHVSIILARFDLSKSRHLADCQSLYPRLFSVHRPFVFNEDPALPISPTSDRPSRHRQTPMEPAL